MSKCKVLVVDDELAMRVTIAANLELEGFEVLEAATGTAALQVLRDSPVDLVLTDVRMPGMNGVELFRHIRELHPELPVILMTAFALEGLVQDALREGAFTILPKPFAVEHLIVALTSAARLPVVLVVDDQEPVAESTAAALRSVGVRASAVTTGAKALEVVSTGSVDVCVVDMIMPDLDGAALIERVHQLDRGVVCIAVSGHDVKDMFRRVAAQVFAFFKKPVAPEELIEVIARARGVASGSR